MEVLSNKVINFMLRNEIISESDKEIYLFGLILMLRVLLNAFTLIIIGICFNMLGESMVFVFFSLLIRSYSGGFHADNPIVCYLISLLVVIVFVLSIKFQIWNLHVGITIVILSVGIFFFYAPVENKNRILEEIERRIYRRRLFRIINGLLLLMFAFMLLGRLSLLYAGCFAFGMSAFMILLVRVVYHNSFNKMYSYGE